MPHSIPRSVQRVIRFLGVLSAIGCAILLFSFGTVAVAVCFRPDSNGINPFFAILGVIAAFFFLFAGIYVAKTLLFAPLSDIATRVPTAGCITAYLVATSIFFNPAMRDFARGNVYLDFSRTFAPYLITWITYRLLRFYIEGYFPKQKT